MIRLSAAASDYGFTFTSERAGELLFTTGHRVDLAEHMLGLGIDNPLQLIDAAKRWGEVNIHEDANPDWVSFSTTRASSNDLAVDLLREPSAA